MSVECLRVAEPALLGGVEQHFVGRTAGKEKRESGRQVEITDAMDRSRAHSCRRALGAVEKLGARQNRRQCGTDAGVEIAVRPRSAVERERSLQVAAGHRPAIGAVRDRREDLRGTRKLLGLRRRAAHEHSAAAWRLADARWLERPDHLETADAGDAVFAGSGAERVQHLVRLRVRPGHERHTNLVRTGRETHGNVLEPAVDGGHGRGLLLVDRLQVVFTTDLSLEDLAPVDCHDERVTVFHAADVPGARQPGDVERVLAVCRKLMLDDQTAPCAGAAPRHARPDPFLSRGDTPCSRGAAADRRARVRSQDAPPRCTARETMARPSGRSPRYRTRRLRRLSAAWRWRRCEARRGPRWRWHIQCD